MLLFWAVWNFGYFSGFQIVYDMKIPIMSTTQILKSCVFDKITILAIYTLSEFVFKIFYYFERSARFESWRYNNSSCFLWKNSVMSGERRWKNSVKCLLILVSMPVMTWGRWASHVTKNIFTKNNNFAYFSDVWKTPIFRGTKRTGWQSMKSNLR